MGGVGRQVNIDPLLDHAVSQGWLRLNGQRVIPGEDPPDPLTSARYAVVPDGSYS